ncbi:hypothetical protein PJL18_03823 [Paenarthrobacter nicotinovorans]|nr:hypothetical protein [Paenarthrobacter nicotinovorans]
MLDVRTQDIPEPFVAAFADQVQVNLTHSGQVVVGVIDGDGFDVVHHFQTVVRHMPGLQRFQDRSPYSVRLVFHGGAAGLRHHGDGLGQVLHCPDGHVAVVIEVGAKDRMRRVVSAGRHAFQGLGVHMQGNSGPFGTC